MQTTIPALANLEPLPLEGTTFIDYMIEPSEQTLQKAENLLK